MIEFLGVINVIPYVKGSNTGEVGEKLEDRYKIIERFYNFIAEALEAKFVEYYERETNLLDGFERALFLTSNWLTDQFREYIEMAKHGLKTKASQMRGDPAFIDTMNYYRSVQIILEQK